MSAVTSASFCWTLLSVCLLFVSADQRNITAESGQNVTLPCRAPNNKTIIGVEWSRPDLEPEYVFFHQDEKSDPDNQHPSFKNRVDLQDRQMKDGDLSLVLKDVTTADSGKYECRAIMTGTNPRKRDNLDGDPISIISLSVVGLPGQRGGLKEAGRKGFGSICLEVFVVLIVVISFVILIEYKERRKHKKRASSY